MQTISRLERKAPEMNKLFSTHYPPFLSVLLLLVTANVFAEEQPYIAFEAFHLQIKLSKDGTGIIKGIKCEGCDFKYVKITPKSKASINGVDVNILEARKRVGKMAMVSFNPLTQEVQYIRWSE